MFGQIYTKMDVFITNRSHEIRNSTFIKVITEKKGDYTESSYLYIDGQKHWHD